MDRQEALLRLGLTEAASADDINRAWRQAMKAVHPDTGSNPDPALTVLLNDARAVALAGRPQDVGQLVPLSAVRELIKADMAVSGATERASERTLRKITMHHVGGLAFRKRQRTILASVSAGVTVILGAITAFGKLGDSEDWVVMYQPLFGVATGVGLLLTSFVAVAAWRVTTMERTLALDLEEIADTLDDRTAYVDVLEEIDVGKFWTRQELLAAVEQWARREPGARRGGAMSAFIGPAYSAVPVSHVAAEIGPYDFVKLLLAKGQELELIKEREMVREDGRAVYGYERIGSVPAAPG